jgi:hypothetical protein
LSANRPTPVVVAYCRAGFEPEATADLARLMEAAGTAGRIDANNGDGFVTASLEAFDAKRWSSAFDRHPPVFVRGSFIARVRMRSRRRRMPGAPTASRRSSTRLPRCRSGHLPARGSNFLTPMKARRCRRSHGRWLRVSTKRCANWGSSMPTRAAADSVPARPEHRPRRHEQRDHRFALADGYPTPADAARRAVAVDREARRGFLVFLGDGEAELLRPGMRAVDLGAAPAAGRGSSRTAASKSLPSTTVR